MKPLACCFIPICLCLAYGCGTGRKRTTTSKAAQTRPVVKFTNQKHPPTGFHKLRIGMPFHQVVELVGLPNRDIGSGTRILVYDIHPEGCVVMQFLTLDALHSFGGHYIDEQGRMVEIAPGEGELPQPGAP